ncbi:MAG: PH domain-containing protein [Betaproteobacteria bacterium]|nr:PH domain-containing protein [Betaproteobacteria bacterium]
MSEHEFEPVHGLPEPLPAGEALLWQGSPRAFPLARRLFHVVPLAGYFAILAAWSAGNAWMAGENALGILAAILFPAALGALALGILALVAWLMARTTVYTITDRRLVLRVGVVLSVTFNIPFGSVASAGLRLHADGTGDLPIALAGDDRIAYLHLWPHARPWRFARPEPMLRCVPEGERVATILAEAILASQGAAVRAATRESAADRARAPNDRATLAAAR